MFTYDDLWTMFLTHYKVDSADLPQTVEKIHENIQYAVRLVNNRMQFDVKVVADDSTETLLNLDDDILLLLAHYLRLVHLMNEKSYFEQLWQPFAHDVGLRNFGTQLKSIKDSVEEQLAFIDSIILNQMEDFL